jgi:effector-binding domain-containing protein
MKYFKITGIFLLVAAGVLIITSMVLPSKQRIERVIFVKAPASVVFQQLAKLENFNHWSVWNQHDSTIKNTFSGKDGTIGASSSWVGDPEISGEGKIVIAYLEPNRKIIHNINFIKPKKTEAESEFKLEEINGSTKITWEFDLATPRPWNIFNLFYNMDKKMGKDFEEGLINLKTAIEKTKNTTTGKTYDVTPMNFQATSFAFIRQQVKWSDIPSFFAQNLPLIYSASSQAKITPGIPTGLFYVWDENNQQADLAAAISLPAGTKLSDTAIQITNIPASKAVYVDYYGAYDKMNDAYSSIDKYLAANNLKQKYPVIEQYITDPAIEKDTSKWLTKIIFTVE